MDPSTAWQAIGQRPWRFLASSWPWRSLAYLCCGFAPSALVAAGLIALVASPFSDLVPVAVPLVVLALLLSGPLVAGTSGGGCGSLRSSPHQTSPGGPRGPRGAPSRPATASSASWRCG